MDEYLIWLGKMSFQAVAAVCAVYAVRLLFDRMRFPKKYSCFLWTIPYLVMGLPWRIKCSLGLWHGSQSEYIPVRMPDKKIFIDGGTYLLSDHGESVLLGQMAGHGETAPSYAAVFVGIWIGGIALLLLKTLVSYYGLRRRLVCRIPVRDNIYMADDIDTPFVLGTGSPEIFLPSCMEKEMLTYVIEHEKMHIKRRDPLVKAAAFLITCIHWFNPAAWAAYHGLAQDMEMACDEGAVHILGQERAQAYAEALVKAAAGQEAQAGTLLAFGEGSVKKRIKNILEKKRSVRVSAAVGITAVLVLGAGFLTEAKELSKLQYMTDAWEKLFSEQQEILDDGAHGEQAEAPEAYPVWHRDGYVETKLHLYVPQSAKDSEYVTEGFWPEAQRELLAQSAMRELYDLTGTQIEECFYFAYDHGYFVFGQTEEDLERGRSFYCRQFENGAMIPGIDMASARRLWYSPVDMMALPDGYGTMTEADKAAWFVRHSGLYNGKKIESIYQPYDWDFAIWRVVMEDDTAYEIFLDSEVNSFSNLAGPYPNSDIQH